MNSELAELYGALIGDGCICLYNVKDRTKPRMLVLFTGHLLNDLDYYRDTLTKLVFNQFGVYGCLYKRHKYTCLRYIIGSKSVFSCFESLEFPVGKKFNLIIPSEILASNSFAIACIRGIFDTDGCVYSRYKKRYDLHKRIYCYAVIQFKMNSITVLNQVKQVFLNNDINSNKIIRESRAYVLGITD